MEDEEEKKQHCPHQKPATRTTNGLININRQKAKVTNNLEVPNHTTKSAALR